MHHTHSSQSIDSTDAIVVVAGLYSMVNVADA
jgi:hypothetical protein